MTDCVLLRIVERRKYEEALLRAKREAEEARAAAEASRQELAAANGALDPGVDDLGRLWQAVTTLREHRGDGHFAAMVAADLDGAEVLVLRCGLDMSRETMQPIRGWTDEQWDAAAERLAGRGLLNAGVVITAAGRDVKATVEETTDRIAGRPWAAPTPRHWRKRRSAARCSCARAAEP